MARVEMTPSLCDQFTGGMQSIEVEAASILQLVRALDMRFPGLGAHIEDRVAVAVDGAVVRDWTFPLTDQAEVFLIPRIAGGRAAGAASQQATR